MQFTRILPSSSLQPVVKYYWLIAADHNDVPFSQILFPFDSFELIFNLGNNPGIMSNNGYDDLAGARSFFAGQFTKPVTLHYPADYKSIGICLQPWAGKFLFNIPAEQFTNRITPLEYLDKQSRLREQLLAAKDVAGYIDCLESYLLEKIQTAVIDPVASIIAQSIQGSTSVQLLQDIPSKMGYSKRRIEQIFLASSGVSMGVFFRKIRFQKVVRMLLCDQDSSLTGVGLDAGYYDQSHFIREFKAFSGLTPKKFRSGIAMNNTSSEMSELLTFTA